MVGSDILIIQIDETDAVLWQHFDLFHFFSDDVVQGMEGIQMLGTDRSDDAILRFDKVHQIRDIRYLIGTHLTHKDFMGRL